MEARALTIVAQRYALHERVGQGGCGVVYRATDLTTGETVAVKMLSRAVRHNPSFVERLVREQQALLALAGTHAVAAIDLCRADTGELCLVMEWLAGADLEHHLNTREQNGTPFTVDELLHVMRPVLETLAKAHEIGIVHRDVKPANIFLLSEERGVRLLDFGFSRLKTSVTLTAADTVMGSPSYIAPEAWLEGSKAIGKQADLYAAGVIVFRALAGRVPFEGASLVETMQLVTTAPRPTLAELRPELPRVMDEWLEYALAIAPERRFQHAQSFLEALSAALLGVGLPQHTLPSGAAHALPPPPKTTPGERQNALSTALGRAASLLKRVASSFSRAPAPTTEPATGAPTPEQPRAQQQELAPPPRTTPSRVRTKPALPPLVRPRGSSQVLPVVNPVDAVNVAANGSEPAHEVPSPPESDRLIAELLPPSLPPPAPPEPLAPAPTPALEPELPSAAVELPEAPTPAKPSKKAAKPRAAKPRAAKPRAAKPNESSSAKAKPAKRAAAKTGSTKTKPRKTSDQTAPGAARKKAAPPPKPATKTAPTQATAPKQKATRKRTGAVAATPHPSASEPLPAARRRSRSGPGPRVTKASSKRTTDKAVTTLDKVEQPTVDKVEQPTVDKVEQRTVDKVEEKTDKD